MKKIHLAVSAAIGAVAAASSLASAKKEDEYLDKKGMGGGAGGRGKFTDDGNGTACIRQNFVDIAEKKRGRTVGYTRARALPGSTFITLSAAGAG